MLDFGLSKELPEGFGLGLFELMFSMMTLNESAMVRAFQELGFETKTGDTDTFLRSRAACCARSETGALRGRVHRGDDRRAVRGDPRGPGGQVPSDFVLVGRVFALLSGIAHTLGYRANVLAAMGAGPPG